jgi:hypothetical protein
VRTEKATGIRNLPFREYKRNKARLLAANIAADLLAAAGPETPRATILHIPARLASHARKRIQAITTAEGPRLTGRRCRWGSL